MRDRTISAHHVTAAALWTIGLLLITLDMIGVSHTHPLGLLFACAGGVINVRGFLCCLTQREQNAFDLGREVGPLRSVDRR